MRLLQSECQKTAVSSTSNTELEKNNKSKYISCWLHLSALYKLLSCFLYYLLHLKRIPFVSLNSFFAINSSNKPCFAISPISSLV
uniref:Uncharacterized protein n=1 Tax=Anguilla anguilla TaxID=7936 RepID=A0A0E9WYS1_ANGAN